MNEELTPVCICRRCGTKLVTRGTWSSYPNCGILFFLNVIPNSGKTERKKRRKVPE